MRPSVGRSVKRVDGRQKVTGAARYTADIALPGLAHAVIVGATVPSGRVAAIDVGRAIMVDGVLAILTHHNIKKVVTPHLVPPDVGAAAPGQSFFPMQDDVVYYAGQPVAIVVADSHECAQHASWLIDISYVRKPSVTTLDEGRDAEYEAETLLGGLLPGRVERGDVDAALAEADVCVDVSYRFAASNHTPLEPSATTAVWDGDRVTVHDSTMGVRASQVTLAHLLGLSVADVRVIAPFVGGGFDAKALTWPHVTLAAIAARHVERPVRLSLTRPQMFTSTGHREEQEQRIVIGARADGVITVIDHEKRSLTSHFDDWAEPVTTLSSQIYATPNYRGVYRLVRGNTMTPTFTRAAGSSLGAVALETAMDELAEKLGVDPVELRIRAHSPVDQNGNPWSSGGFVECLRRGAELFGWADRDPTPRSRRDGDCLIGSGMAAAAYPVVRLVPSQRARTRIFADGSAVVETAAQEVGTGVTTMMTQIGADALGVPLEAMHHTIGDTDLPDSGAAVGSGGSVLVGSAVHAASTALREQLIAMAIADAGSPLYGCDPSKIDVRAGRMALRDSPAVGETYAELLHRNQQFDVEAVGSWLPPRDSTHGLMTFGAQFAEVAVDPELGFVHVRRMVGVFAPGRVLNPTLARSQLMGGMVWGLGQALLEGNRMDAHLGRWAANTLGEYLVPVNADAPDVIVDFVEVEDDVVSALGVKGVGEIGQVGSAAAIVNAVHHATGRRVRELPMTAELVMDPPAVLV
jgi:xanthine dehydrogenase YagR molybdenum-binding subunit